MEGQNLNRFHIFIGGLDLQAARGRGIALWISVYRANGAGG
jgi:hypothetical protein